VRLLHLSRGTIAAAVALLLLLAPTLAQANDPTQVWRTLTTPHFYIHYYKNVRHDLAATARLVARAAETAHDRLTPALRHAPSTRTHVVVTDDTDGANGSAQIVPMNIIRLYVTGSTPLSTLNDYDDWMYGLVLHEYAHIVHIDTIHGLARLVNYVLGKTWAPNQIQPRWFIEGLAVYYESERSAGGRNRCSIHDMYLRVAVLEGKLLEIDQITSYTRMIPRGNVPYLYGSRFLKYLAERFGEEKLTEISHRYGSTIIPYSINRIAKQTLGYTYVELYQDFKRHLRRRYELQRDAAAKRGLTSFRKITDHGESSATPSFSTDGRELVYVDTDGHSMTKIKVLDVASGRVKEGYDLYGGSGVTLTPDAQHIVYGESSTWRTFYGYDDLFVRDRRTGAVRRLTHGLRSRDPAVSPDGKRVAFVTNDLGNMDLALIPLQGGAHQVLQRGQRGDQYSSPRWSPDGKLLVYSRWMAGGDRDIYLLEVASGKVRRLTADRAIDVDPVFSPDGRRIYFSSDRTGIYNVYCYELDSGRLLQVTNVLGGAFAPAVSPDERQLYYIGFSAKGNDLHAMSLARRAYLPALPYVNDRPAPTVIDPPPRDAYPDRPYSPWPTIYPRTWSFHSGSDAFGTAMGIDLVGGDVVGNHHWSLTATTSTVRENVSYGVSYSYSGLWPYISLDTSRYKGPRGGVVLDGVRKNYVEENFGGGGVLGLPVLRRVAHNADITLGYRINWFRDADGTQVLVEPDQLSPRLPEMGILAGVTLGISYSNVQRYTWSVVNSKGRTLGLSLRMDHPYFGSDFKSTQVTYGYSEWIPLPWARDHTLSLRLAGGVAAGNLTRRGVFFIGGFPEQDVLRSIIDMSRVGGTFLRGYPPGVVYGDQYHLLNVEYHLPLFNIEKGLSTLPIYFTHVHGSVFVDFGNAFFGDPQLSDFKVGVGGELILEAVIGYVLGTSFRVGYARGLMDKGGNQWHFLVGYPF
jgi:dipeptidyl aminopeptidase/acylaminoacyl peptidase